MSLLAPIGLLGLLLLPIIVAIHLWRIRHRRYELSSTLLWSQVLAQTPLRRPRRLPARLLLLALQLAALACGAVALSRPAWVAAGAHRRLVVAVDTSLAMSAVDVKPSRLARAQDAVRALIDGLAPGDTMTLVDAGPAPRVLATSGDHAILRGALKHLVQNYGPSSLADDGPLLSGLIRAAARPGNRGDPAYLFAPFGANHAQLTALERAAPPLRVNLVGVSADDRAVAGLTISCSSTACEAYARLVNTAARPVTTRLQALVDGAGPTQMITLPPNSAVPVGLSLPRSLLAAAHTVELRLAGGDPLPADDTAWAAVPLTIHRTALLVTNDAATPLAQALRAIPNLTLRTTTPDAYSDDLARRVDLTILDPSGADSAGTDTAWAGLEPPGNLFIVNPATGGSLFTLLGTQPSPGAVSVRPDGAAISSPLPRGAVPRPPDTDPLLPGSLVSGVDLSSLIVASAGRARLPAWAHADVEGDTGPLLFSGTTGGRRVAVLLFDPRTTSAVNASNLDTLLAFPALLENVVRLLAPAPPQAIAAGSIAAIPVSRQGAAWIQPAGSLTGTGVQSLASSGDLAALPPLHPGLYSFGGGPGDTPLPIAVDPVVPGDTTSTGLPGAQPSAPPAPVVLSPSFIAPWEGWAGLALLALLVLNGEWWYYVRRT